MADVDPADLVFLDETAAPTTLVPLYARAPRGQRAVGGAPRGRREHVSWLATLTPAGVGESVLVPGAVDRAAFEAFVERALAPSLRPGQVVVLDNLSVHKSARARAAVERAGCRLVFLPTYSPDLNPIELAFAKAKERLRAAAERALDGLVAASGAAIDALTAADARGCYAHCGFALPAN